MELRCYFSVSAFINLFNLLEKLQEKMVYENMIWDFSCFNLDFGMVITIFPNRNVEKEKERKERKQNVGYERCG